MKFNELEIDDYLGHKCNHCGESFARRMDPAIGSIVNYSSDNAFLANLNYNSTVGCIEDGDISYRYKSYGFRCPKCARVSLYILKLDVDKTGVSNNIIDIILLNPFGDERHVPEEVPVKIADDYKEATKISGTSLKGSATIARRCLQATLRNAYPEMPTGELFDEIKWVEEKITFSDEEIIIKDTLHALRKAGNFGAHPPKDGLTPLYELSIDDLKSCFELLELLFDKLYVKPLRTAEKLKSLQKRMFPEKSEE